MTGDAHLGDAHRRYGDEAVTVSVLHHTRCAQCEFMGRRREHSSLRRRTISASFTGCVDTEGQGRPTSP